MSENHKLVQRYGLSAIEALILGHIMVGLNNAEIAATEGRSQAWAKKHVSALLRATGARDRARLMAAMWGAGWGREALARPSTLPRGYAGP